MLLVKRYTAGWCQPCQHLSPIFSELQNEMREVNFQTIDVDQNKEQTQLDNVTSVPTVVIIKDGQQVHRFNGVLSKQVIAGIIKKYL